MQFLLFAIAIGAVVYVVILIKRGGMSGETDARGGGEGGWSWGSDSGQCDSSDSGGCDGGGDGGGGD